VFITKAIKKLWYVIAALLILAALLVSVMRLLTPVMNEHRLEFEKLAASFLKRPVSIEHIQLGWHGLDFEVLLNNVIVLDEKSHQPTLAIRQLELDISLLRSLKMRQVLLDNLTVSGVHLEIHQNDYGNIRLDKLTSLNVHDRLTGSLVRADAIIAWIFLQPNLRLKDISLRYITAPHQEKQFSVTTLALQNKDLLHVLSGEVLLEQDIPTKINLDVDWLGNVSNLDKANANIYLYLEGVSLSQWVSSFKQAGYKLNKGLASAKIWATVADGKFLSIQSKFQAYGVELYSLSQKSSEVINRISANVGWRKDGDTQVIAGDQVFIDFIDHLWPSTNFFIHFKQDGNQHYSLSQLAFAYIDLADVKRFALKSTLLSEEIRNALIALNPRGDILNFRANFPSSASLSLDPGLALDAQFKGLCLTDWKDIPTFNNLSGELSWDGTHGKLKINSDNTLLTLKQFFKQPLNLDHFVGDMTFIKNPDQSWVLQGNNIQIMNSGVDFKTNLTLLFKEKESPLIDLTAQFTLKNAENIYEYSPLKTFDSDFQRWLKGAFLRGQAENGNVRLKGPINDFPFEKSTGIFTVSTDIKNVDLNFSSDWPVIQNMEGTLLFSYHSMLAKINSGKMLDLPLKNVVAEISYIGADQPQILTLNGEVNSNFESGLRFIQATPIQKTFAKDLVDLAAFGPMNLKLSLKIPLSKPEAMQVNGSVILDDTLLKFPKLKLSLTNVNGVFSFTDQTIEARNVHANLFHNPLLFNLSTVLTADKKSQVRADLESTISVGNLEEWFDISLKQFVKGAAHYQAQIFLPSLTASTTRFIVKSNLVGLSLNLPEPYAKNTNDKRLLQMDMSILSAINLKMKLNYDDSITAALYYAITKNKLEFVNGELQFGGKEANWQNEKGIVVDGTLKRLNGDAWQQFYSSLRLPTDPSASLKILRDVDLNIDELNFYGANLHRVNLQIKNAEAAWKVNLTSSELSGQMLVPNKLVGNTVRGEFQHVYLTDAIASTTSHKINPKSLPSFSFNMHDVRYNGLTLGDVLLDVSPSRNGLLIRKLQLKEPFLALNAMGNWTFAGDHNESHFLGNISSPHLTQALASLGFNLNNFVASTADAVFDLTWNNTPYHFSLSDMSGKISLKLGEGEILQLSDASNAKLGLGRLLNVFSLKTIPRRLNLNFSDLTEKGYSFDTLKGDFIFKRGDAVTDNMRFDGPVASVGIRGRIGLVARDFNIKLSVKPYVTSSLPVVAAIAGAPLVGVAMFVVDKVVSHTVVNEAAYQYNVTGSWSNPVWTQINTMMGMRRK